MSHQDELQAAFEKLRSSSPRLRIAFIHPDLGIGGAERLIVDTAVGLQARGHKVKVFTSHHDNSHCFAETRDGTLNVIVRGDFLPTNLGGKAKILCAILRNLYLALTLTLFESKDFDVLIVDQLSISIPVLRFTGIRILFYCHFPDKLLAKRESWIKKLYRVPFDFMEEVTTRMADCTVVNSNFTRDIFKQSFPSIKRSPKVLYPAIRTEAYNGSGELCAEFRQYLKGKTIILSINRFERKKNIGLAIQAFSKLQHEFPTQFPSLVLIIAGGYDPRVPENVEHLSELNATATSLGLTTVTTKTLTSPTITSAQVIFLPSFDDEHRTFLLSESLCLLYTPTNEHFGIVPVEAMYAGLPVIAANSGGPLESILDGVTGFLRAPEPDAFAEALSILVKTPSRKSVIGAAGKQRVEAKFTLEAFMGQMEEYLEGLFVDVNWDAGQLYPKPQRESFLSRIVQVAYEMFELRRRLPTANVNVEELKFIVLRQRLTPYTREQDREKERLRSRQRRAARTPAEKRAVQSVNTTRHNFVYEAARLQERHAAVYNEDELASMDTNGDFTIKADRKVLYELCAEKLSFQNMTNHCCVVCECDHPKSSFDYMNLTAEVTQSLRDMLLLPNSYTATINPILVSQYDVSSFDSSLVGLFLSPFGFYCSADSLHFPVTLVDKQLVYESRPGIFLPVASSSLLLGFCRGCRKFLSKYQKRPLATAMLGGDDEEGIDCDSQPTKKMPPDAIANRNWIGRLPSHLPTITRTTEAVVSLKMLNIYLSSLIGNSERKTVRSHHYVLQNSMPPLRHVPASIVDSFRIAFVGPWDSQQKAEQSTRYAVQPCALELLRFLETNHLGYLAHKDFILAEKDRQSIFSDDYRSAGTDAAVNEKLVRLLDHTTYNAGAVESPVEVSTAHIIVNASTPNAEYAVDTTESRDVGMFKSSNLVKSRQLEDSFQQQYVSMRVRKSAVEREDWTIRDIHECYHHARQVEDALKLGSQPPPQPQVVKRLFDLKKLVLPGLRAFAGSDESRSSELHRAFGIQKRLGTATFFTTISPATAFSWVVAINCRLVNGEHCELKFTLGEEDLVITTNVDSLPKQADLANKDALRGLQPDGLPDKNIRGLAASLNPHESAEYARRVVDVFMEHFLGWDFTYRAPKRGGGMIGVARWFKMSPETQKMGDVHFHFVGSLFGMPRTSEEFRQKLQSSEWAQR
ncbi:Alpha-1,3-mannosyltransferase-like protein [Podochytrium sp. JEL0797]|nr:Alpha-1,3-mannosyltransferase-like protein [Podochytrium sp. JEL0797]